MTQTEKKKIVEKLVVVPRTAKRPFWGREIKSLNELMKLYPEEDFWRGLSFGPKKKFDTLIILRSGYYAIELKKKYGRYKYTIPKPEEIILGEVCGEDYKSQSKPKTIRNFLGKRFFDTL